MPQQYNEGSLAAATEVFTSNVVTSVNVFMCGCYGTHAGGQVIIEGLRGSTWTAISGLVVQGSSVSQSDQGRTESGTITLADNEGRGWRTPVGDWTQVRIRCVAISSGAIKCGIGYQPAADAPPPIRTEDEKHTTSGGRFTANVAAGTTTVAAVISDHPGRLVRIAVLALGTAALTLYDSASAASGIKLFAIPASAAAGTIYELHTAAVKGITAGKVSNSPEIMVTYY